METPTPSKNNSALAKQDTSKKEINKKYIPCPGGGQVEEGQTCKPVADIQQCPNGGPRIDISKGETCPKPSMKQCEFGPPVLETAQCAEKPKPAAPKRPNPIPQGNVANWVTTDDYPDRDLQQEHQGSVSVRLTVGPNGRVSDCSVTSSSGFSGLDSATCSRIKSRAKFQPALDGDGNPTSGSYSKSVRWVVPKE